MIMHANAKPWTKAERARADRMAEEIGCVFCRLGGSIGPCHHRHHVKRGNKRMGHWYTLPLCEMHHTACHNGTIKNAEQLHAWIKVQHMLNMSDELPPTKIVPRRHIPEAEVSR